MWNEAFWGDLSTVIARHEGCCIGRLSGYNEVNVPGQPPAEQRLFRGVPRRRTDVPQRNRGHVEPSSC